MRRAYQKSMGQRITLAKVVECCRAAWGEDADESREVIFAQDILDVVPGLSEDQVVEELAAAAEEWASENTAEVVLPEVLHEVGKLTSALFTEEPAVEAAAISLEALNPKLADSPASERTDIPISREQTFEGMRQAADVRQADALRLVDQGVPLDTLIRAASLNIERRLEERGKGNPSRAVALKHLLSSAEIICDGDDLLECKL